LISMHPGGFLINNGDHWAIMENKKSALKTIVIDGKEYGPYTAYDDGNIWPTATEKCLDKPENHFAFLVWKEQQKTEKPTGTFYILTDEKEYGPYTGSDYQLDAMNMCGDWGLIRKINNQFLLVINGKEYGPYEDISI